MSSYVGTMLGFAREVGALSGRYEFAEGWRRHNPMGFCAEDADRLADILEDHVLKRQL